jgi:catechol 2,3-dioxygenase-like lactoylglutathione lyase family enzyme
MTRTALGASALLAAFCLTPSPHSTDLLAPTSGGQEAAAPQVVGARSYSPMVENVDAVMVFYRQLGLKVPPPEIGDSYPWDTEEWHYDLHGGQAPRSQMRFSYATLPGAVPPATPLLVEPVEHRNVDRQARVSRVQDPGVTTLVLLVRDLDAAAMRVPPSARQRVRRVTAYGGTARAMTVAVPGAHLVELLQLDPVPQTTAPADAAVIGAWVRVTVDNLERTLRLYRDQFGLPFRDVPVTDDALGGLTGASGAKLQLATATLPGTRMTLEFLEATGIERRPLAARIQDPGAARLQLTVRNLETAIGMLKQAGPSTVVSSRGEIITQPQYRVAVVSDLNGLFLVLTDRPERK